MAQLGHRLEAGPEDGEQHMTTSDVREMLDRLSFLGDDGTTLIQAKTTVRGRVLRMWATTAPSSPLNGAEDWDTLAARYAPPVVPAEPAAEVREIEPSAVTPRALTARGGKHAK